MASGNNIKRFREARGWSRPELGKRMGTSGQQVERLEKGQRRLTQDWIDKAASAFGVDSTDIINGKLPPLVAPETDRPAARQIDAGETAGVLRLDLSYAMGPGTDLDAAHVEGEPVQFDIGFLRTLTPSPPDRLRIVNGVGDSMMPTIHDREDLIIDLNQTRLNMQDRIWAIALYGAGALKRLRAIGRDRILVISDNPDVQDQEVDAADVMIVARLVGSIKRH